MEDKQDRWNKDTYKSADHIFRNSITASKRDCLVVHGQKEFLVHLCSCNSCKDICPCFSFFFI